MNEQPLYEQQIASKLEQLPVPDMADAIWMRIKDQLDADMPTGGHTPPPPPRPRSAGRGKGIFGIIVASIVLIYLITPKKQSHIPAPDRVPADSTSFFTPSTIQQPGSQPAVKRKESIRSTPEQQHDTVSPVQPPMLPPVQQDSILLTPPVLSPPVIPPMVPVKTDTVPAKKKPRGVKGISDSDYKIVPKNNANPG